MQLCYRQQALKMAASNRLCIACGEVEGNKFFRLPTCDIVQWWKKLRVGWRKRLVHSQNQLSLLVAIP